MGSSSGSISCILHALFGFISPVANLNIDIAMPVVKIFLSLSQDEKSVKTLLTSSPFFNMCLQLVKHLVLSCKQEIQLHKQQGVCDTVTEVAHDLQWKYELYVEVLSIVWHLVKTKDIKVIDNNNYLELARVLLGDLGWRVEAIKNHENSHLAPMSAATMLCILGILRELPDTVNIFVTNALPLLFDVLEYMEDSKCRLVAWKFLQVIISEPTNECKLWPCSSINAEPIKSCFSGSRLTKCFYQALIEDYDQEGILKIVLRILRQLSSRPHLHEHLLTTCYTSQLNEYSVPNILQALLYSHRAFYDRDFDGMSNRILCILLNFAKNPRNHELLAAEGLGLSSFLAVLIEGKPNAADQVIVIHIENRCNALNIAASITQTCPNFICQRWAIGNGEISQKSQVAAEGEIHENLPPKHLICSVALVIAEEDKNEASLLALQLLWHVSKSFHQKVFPESIQDYLQIELVPILCSFIQSVHNDTMRLYAVLVLGRLIRWETKFIISESSESSSSSNLNEFDHVFKEVIDDCFKWITTDLGSYIPQTHVSSYGSAEDQKGVQGKNYNNEVRDAGLLEMLAAIVECWQDDDFQKWGLLTCCLEIFDLPRNVSVLLKILANMVSTIEATSSCISLSNVKHLLDMLFKILQCGTLVLDQELQAWTPHLTNVLHKLLEKLINVRLLAKEKPKFTFDVFDEAEEILTYLFISSIQCLETTLLFDRSTWEINLQYPVVLPKKQHWGQELMLTLSKGIQLAYGIDADKIDICGNSDVEADSPDDVRCRLAWLYLIICSKGLASFDSKLDESISNGNNIVTALFRFYLLKNRYQSNAAQITLLFYRLIGNESQRTWLMIMLLTSSCTSSEHNNNQASPASLMQIFCEVMFREWHCAVNAVFEYLKTESMQLKPSNNCIVSVASDKIMRICNCWMDSLIRILCWVQPANYASDTSLSANFKLSMFFEGHKVMQVSISLLLTQIESTLSIESQPTVQANDLYLLQQKCLLLQKRLKYFSNNRYKTFQGISSLYLSETSKTAHGANIFISHSGSEVDRQRLIPFLQSIATASVHAICGYMLDGIQGYDNANSETFREERIHIFELNSLKERLRSCSSAIILLSRDYQKSVLARVEAELIVAEQQKANSSLTVQFICLDDDEDFVKTVGNTWCKECIGKGRFLLCLLLLMKLSI
jgi:hypothetical protein